MPSGNEPTLLRNEDSLLTSLNKLGVNRNKFTRGRGILPYLATLSCL